MTGVGDAEINMIHAEGVMDCLKKMLCSIRDDDTVWEQSNEQQ